MTEQNEQAKRPAMTEMHRYLIAALHRVPGGHMIAREIESGEQPLTPEQARAWYRALHDSREQGERAGERKVIQTGRFLR